MSLDTTTAAALRLLQLVDPAQGPSAIWDEIKDRVPAAQWAAVNRKLLTSWIDALFPPTFNLYVERDARIALIPGAAAVTVERLRSLGANTSADVLEPWAQPGAVATDLSRGSLLASLVPKLRAALAQDVAPLAAGSPEAVAVGQACGSFVEAASAALNTPPNANLLREDEDAFIAWIKATLPELATAIADADDALVVNNDLPQAVAWLSGVSWLSAEQAVAIAHWRHLRLQPWTHPLAHFLVQLSEAAQVTPLSTETKTTLDRVFDVLGPARGLPQTPVQNIQAKSLEAIYGALADLIADYTPEEEAPAPAPAPVADARDVSYVRAAVGERLQRMGFTIYATATASTLDVDHIVYTFDVWPGSGGPRFRVFPPDAGSRYIDALFGAQVEGSPVTDAAIEDAANVIGTDVQRRLRATVSAPAAPVAPATAAASWFQALHPFLHADLDGFDKLLADLDAHDLADDWRAHLARVREEKPSELSFVSWEYTGRQLIDALDALPGSKAQRAAPRAALLRGWNRAWALDLLRHIDLFAELVDDADRALLAPPCQDPERVAARTALHAAIVRLADAVVSSLQGAGAKRADWPPGDFAHAARNTTDTMLEDAAAADEPDPSDLDLLRAVLTTQPLTLPAQWVTALVHAIEDSGACATGQRTLLPAAGRPMTIAPPATTGDLGSPAARELAETLATTPDVASLAEAVTLCRAAADAYPSAESPVPRLREVLARLDALFRDTPPAAAEARRIATELVVRLEVVLGAAQTPKALVQYVIDVLRAGLASNVEPVEGWWRFVDGVAQTFYRLDAVEDAKTDATADKADGRHVQLVRGWSTAPPELPAASVPTGTVADEAVQAAVEAQEQAQAPASIEGVVGLLWDPEGVGNYVYFDGTIAAQLEAAGVFYPPNTDNNATDRAILWVANAAVDAFPVAAWVLPGGQAPIHAAPFSDDLWAHIEPLNAVLAEPRQTEPSATEAAAAKAEAAAEAAEAEAEEPLPPTPLPPTPEAKTRGEEQAAESPLRPGMRAVLDAAVKVLGGADEGTVVEGFTGVLGRIVTDAGPLQVQAVGVDDATAMLSARLEIAGRPAESLPAVAVPIIPVSAWVEATARYFDRIRLIMQQGTQAQAQGNAAANLTRVDPTTGLPPLRAGALRRMLADAATVAAERQTLDAPFTTLRD